MRNMVSFPQDGPIRVAYGCSECYWQYRPIVHGVPVTSELGQAVGLWEAQVAFEMHDCAKSKIPVSDLSAPPRKKSA